MQLKLLTTFHVTCYNLGETNKPCSTNYNDFSKSQCT